MAGFLKVLFRNLLEGPSTDPYPFGETFSPPSIRGRVVIDPELCMGCGICVYSCTAKAINISPLKDDAGYKITVWRNICCLCASCRHYCPTGAATLIDNWHSAHPGDTKYDEIEQQTIKYVPCTACGKMIRPLPAAMAKRLYASSPELDPEHVRHLCPQCRQLEDAKKIVEEAGHSKPAEPKAS